MKKVGMAVIAGLAGSSVQAQNVELHEAFSGGTVYGDLRLRYEQVQQDNALKDAEGVTMRTRLGYRTLDYFGVSGLVEFEDSRNVLGFDDYNDTLGKNTNYSVIADPETTELDQAYLQYKVGQVTGRLGRQVITYDNHRFVGHVGWRQDRQTFDAARLTYTPLASVTVDYAYLSQRNRIFAESRDLPSKDHLVNARYQSPLGSITGYAYLLEVDKGADNALDTFGVRYVGQSDLESLAINYTAEYATQTSESGNNEFDADYYLFEVGISAVNLTILAGYEVLGSDNGQYGFSTPLATLHAQNGWADQFLATPSGGLEDLSFTVKAPLAGGNLTARYHEYSASDSSVNADDLGSEVDLAYQRPFAQHYSAGIKYARYMAGDAAAGKVDTDKLWVTLGAKF
ncbi:MAG: alginate export family protein [Pseudomonadota bacterium]|jgi:hypothetical protein|uniref:alginate export family protein n=1 Tax=Marinobacter sp. TaxID=50741 RepID=UPI002E848708|nr:alginate export family protein [Pseudomonadota bacterium]